MIVNVAMGQWPVMAVDGHPNNVKSHLATDQHAAISRDFDERDDDAYMPCKKPVPNQTYHRRSPLWLLQGRFLLPDQTRELVFWPLKGSFRRTRQNTYVLLRDGAQRMYRENALNLFNTLQKLLLVARTTEKAEAAKQQVSESCSQGDSSRIVPLACDVSSFDSIHKFADNLEKEATNGIDVACLNAGICTARGSEPQYTEDNLELTVATNHFGGNFLLMHRIVHLMNPGGRVVVTASEVQNMKQNDGELPSFQNFAGLKDDNGKATKHVCMLDGSEFHYFRAYQLSKLCNVTFTKELNRRLASRNIVANCFSPGFIAANWFLPIPKSLRHARLFILCQSRNEWRNDQWGADAWCTWRLTSRQEGREENFGMLLGNIV